MNEYVLTVFSKTGEKLLDEPITAESDEAAKNIATNRLEEENYMEEIHRLVTAQASLLLFHR